MTLLVLALALAAPPAPPSKADKAAIFVLAQDTVAKDPAARLEIELLRALQSKGVPLIDYAELLEPPPPANLEKGERLLAEGRQALDNLDPERAADLFSQAADFYKAHPADAPPSRLAEALVHLGAAFLLAGKNKLGIEAFTRALLVDRTVEPKGELFGDDVHGTWELVRDSLPDMERGELVVESLPLGARARIDGEDVGLTPVPARELTAGRHHVFLTRPGYVPFGAYTDVRANGRTEIRFPLEPTPGLLELHLQAEKVVTAEAFRADEIPPAARSLAAQVKARYLILVGVRTVAGGSTASLQVWDVRTGSRLKDVTFDVDESGVDRAATEVKRWVLAPPEQAMAFHVPPVLKDWRVWAGVAGVAAVTVGAIAIAKGGPSRPNLVLGIP